MSFEISTHSPAYGWQLLFEQKLGELQEGPILSYNCSSQSLFFIEKNIPEAIRAHCPLISPENPSLSFPTGEKSQAVSHCV